MTLAAEQKGQAAVVRPRGRTRPTAALGALVSIAVVLLSLSSLVGSSWLLLAGVAAFGPIVAALVVRPAIGAIDVTVAAPAVIAVDTDATLSITVRNSGSATTDPVHVALLGCFQAYAIDVATLQPGDVVTHVSVRPVARRGVLDEVAVLTSTGVFGLLRTTRHVSTRVGAVAHAQPAVVRAPRGGAESDMWVASRAGIELAGVREWRPGDPTTHLHARSSARRARPIMLERAAPREGSLLVLTVGAGAGAAWEQAVSTTYGLLLDGFRAERVARVAWRDNRGFIPATLRDESEALWWSAAVPEPTLPDRADLDAFLTASAKVTDNLVVVGADAPEAWWHLAEAATARAGVRLRRWPS